MTSNGDGFGEPGAPRERGEPPSDAEVVKEFRDQALRGDRNRPPLAFRLRHPVRGLRVVFIVLTFVTDHYLKLVPTQASILPAAGSCFVQYAALHLPSAPETAAMSPLQP